MSAILLFFDRLLCLYFLFIHLWFGLYYENVLVSNSPTECRVGYHCNISVFNCDKIAYVLFKMSAMIVFLVFALLILFYSCVLVYTTRKF